MGSGLDWVGLENTSKTVDCDLIERSEHERDSEVSQEY